MHPHQPGNPRKHFTKPRGEKKKAKNPSLVGSRKKSLEILVRLGRG